MHFHPSKLIFLDTETTGNEPAKDRLCQICFSDPLEDSPAGSRAAGMKIWNELFKPPVPISVKAMSITHITNAMVADKPAFIGSPAYERLKELLGAHVLVAHNALFDIGMLKNEGLEVLAFICTLRVARHLDEGGVIPEYNLQFLRYYLNVEVSGQAHDAEGDVRVLQAVFDRLYKKVRESSESDEEAIKKLIEISSRPSLFRTFAFGKYKGSKVADVAKADRGYLEWLLKQKMETPDQEQDWIYTLKQALSAR